MVVLDVAPLADNARASSLLALTLRDRTDTFSSTAAGISYYKVDLASAQDVQEVALKVQKEVGHPCVSRSLSSPCRLRH